MSFRFVLVICCFSVNFGSIASDIVSSKSSFLVKPNLEGLRRDTCVESEEDSEGYLEEEEEEKSEMTDEEFNSIMELLLKRRMRESQLFAIKNRILGKRTTDESDFDEPKEKKHKKNCRCESEEEIEDDEEFFASVPKLPAKVHHVFSSKNGGNFYASPEDKKKAKKGVIYLFTREFAEQIGSVPHDQRMNLSEHLSDDSDDEALLNALLLVEIRLRELISKNNNLIGRIIYTGLSKNSVQERYPGHKSDIVHKPLSKTKSSVVLDYMNDQNENVRMSYFLYNVPEKFLPFFEALVSEVLKVRRFGGAGQIADENSWNFLQEIYFEWEERITKLSEKKIQYATEEAVRNLGRAQRMLFN